MSENEHRELACVGVDAVDVASDIARFAAMGLLPALLANHSTGGNIVWASSVFVDKGDSYAPTDEILVSDITGDNAGLIRTRASKAKEAQAALTRAHAEVFTPTWVVKLMVDEADKAWWESHEGATWQDYVRSPRLEITCGEAPYLVGRYDAADGTPVPLDERVGILDRKLRLVCEHTTARKTWVKYAHMALKSTYGYEFQGDNLLIARVNVLATIEDYARAQGYELPESTYRKFATVIGWNLWQMDGLTDRVPDVDGAGREPVDEPDPLGETPQLTGFDEWYASAGNNVVETETEDTQDVTRAMVRDWDRGEVVAFAELKREGSDMKFDYVIGNPPYQEEQEGDNATYSPPVYHHFIDRAYKVGNVVELIHPARFLFNAGRTPKAWNKKMLSDKRVKVVSFWPNADDVFPGQNITGGIAVTYFDADADFGAIGTFTQFPVLNDIRSKVVGSEGFKSLSDIVYTAYAYHLTEQLYTDHPELIGRMSNGHQYDTKSNVLELMPEVFTDERVDEGQISMLGRKGNARAVAWVNRAYISAPDNLDGYKAIISAADGASGTIGKPVPARVIGVPVIGRPGDGTTESFASIGRFDTEESANNLIKYIKTRFARTMLGILKVTQHITPQKWANVPLQDFTEASDIDWSKSVDEIDDQLFEKYGLEDDEIAFIKSHVKEMS